MIVVYGLLAGGALALAGWWGFRRSEQAREMWNLAVRRARLPYVPVQLVEETLPHDRAARLARTADRIAELERLDPGFRRQEFLASAAAVHGHLRRSRTLDPIFPTSSQVRAALEAPQAAPDDPPVTLSTVIGQAGISHVEADAGTGATLIRVSVPVQITAEITSGPGRLPRSHAVGLIDTLTFASTPGSGFGPWTLIGVQSELNSRAPVRTGNGTGDGGIVFVDFGPGSSGSGDGGDGGSSDSGSSDGGGGGGD